ncbi:MAG TPA: gluconate 2-dehydrogenase subunit 3 family protein [Pyrinomonadaceae bacterium]
MPEAGLIALGPRLWIAVEKNQFKTRYPSYDVLDKWSSPDWDDQTREVVRKRLEDIPAIRFFTDEEARLLTTVAERIVPQPDRSQTEKIPIVPWIDEKLYEDKRDGYRYEGMPSQQDAWRLALQGINQSARILFDGKTFVDLDSLSQDVVLSHIERGDPPGAAWEVLPPARFFRDVLCSTIVKIYYAHPLAWNEVGYNGPSSPRGHVRKWEGGVDPWKAHEQE